MAVILPMDDLVKIVVNLSPRSAVRSGFNLALIVGKSAVVPLERRVNVYSNLEAMLEDGFTAAMPEYQAAQLYFAQSSSPSKLAVGVWDEENEAILEAVQDCRKKNRDWYICVPLSADAEQIKLLAAYIEGASPASMLCCTTNELALLEELKALNLRRTMAQFSEKENAVAAIVGWAMGANTGLSGSAYTLMCKTLSGIEVDDLTENQVADIFTRNGNCYICRGAQYNLFERGTMADGTWFDEMINLDMLVNDLQLAIMDLQVSVKKIPQTEGGVNLIKSAMTDPLEKAVRTGFLAGGIWKGTEILNLQNGDAIEKGYLIQSEPVDSQSQADRDARMAPPIYVALKLAGAIHSVIVQVDVNR